MIVPIMGVIFTNWSLEKISRGFFFDALEYGREATIFGKRWITELAGDKLVEMERSGNGDTWNQYRGYI